MDTLNVNKAQAFVSLLILDLGSHHKIQILLVSYYFIVELGFFNDI